MVQHINYGGHLGNDAVLALTHEARIRFLRQLGCSELDAFGSGLIMTDAAVVYQGEGFLGDTLEAAIWVEALSSRGFELYYRFTCERAQTQHPIALVKTGMLCFDYNSRRPVHLSEGLREQLLGA